LAATSVAWLEPTLIASGSVLFRPDHHVPGGNAAIVLRLRARHPSNERLLCEVTEGRSVVRQRTLNMRFDRRVVCQVFGRRMFFSPSKRSGKALSPLADRQEAAPYHPAWALKSTDLNSRASDRRRPGDRRSLGWRGLPRLSSTMS